MKLHSPFIISARLAPALRIGNACISLEGLATVDSQEPGARVLGSRQSGLFIVDIGDREYRIDDVQSGCGGYRSIVEAFEALLAFMEACGESVQFQQRTGREGENAGLFEPAIALWCGEHMDDIGAVRCELMDEDGRVRGDLITD